MRVGDSRDRGSIVFVGVLFSFDVIKYNKVQALVYLKPLRIKEIHRGLGSISSSHKPT